MSKVGLLLDFERKADNIQLYISLQDPNGFRGHRQLPPPGTRSLDLWVRPDDAVEGALAGILPTGVWHAQIDFDRFFEETDYHLVAYTEFGPVADPVHFTYPEGHVVKSQAGWYRGELYAYSSESDAYHPVATIVKATIDAGLDFLSLTDHYTSSHWRKLALLIDHPIALIRSCEICAHCGHANIHGIHQWVDVYVDRPEWTMNHAAASKGPKCGLRRLMKPAKRQGCGNVSRTPACRSRSTLMS